MYNQKIADELGIDVEAIKTWDDFLEAAKKAKKQAIMHVP